MKRIFVLPFLILMMTLSLSFSVKAAPSLDETVEFMVNGDNGWPHKKRWSIDQCVLTTIDDTKLEPWKNEIFDFNKVIFSSAKGKDEANGYSSVQAECNGECWKYYNLGKNLVERKDFYMMAPVNIDRFGKAIRNFISFCPGFKSAF